MILHEKNLFEVKTRRSESNDDHEFCDKIAGLNTETHEKLINYRLKELFFSLPKIFWTSALFILFGKRNYHNFTTYIKNRRISKIDLDQLVSRKLPVLLHFIHFVL